MSKLTKKGKEEFVRKLTKKGEAATRDIANWDDDWKPKLSEITTLPRRILKEHPGNKDIFDTETRIKNMNLADTLISRGFDEPLIVMRDHTSRDEYIILSGHRRNLCAAMVGIEEVPCRIIEEPLSDRQQLCILVRYNNLHTQATERQQRGTTKEKILKAAYGENLLEKILNNTLPPTRIMSQFTGLASKTISNTLDSIRRANTKRTKDEMVADVIRKLEYKLTTKEGELELLFNRPDDIHHVRSMALKITNRLDELMLRTKQSQKIKELETRRAGLTAEEKSLDITDQSNITKTIKMSDTMDDEL